MSIITDSDAEEATGGICKTDFSRNVSRDEVEVLRKYRERKARKSVRRCKAKGLKFSKRICSVTSDLFRDPENVSDAALTELTQVCIEALGSDFDMDEAQSGGSDVSSSSDEEMRSKRFKKQKTDKKLYELDSPPRRRRNPFGHADSDADYYSAKQHNTRRLGSLGRNTLYERQQLHFRNQARINWDAYSRERESGYGQFKDYSPPQEQDQYFDPRIGNPQFRLNEAQLQQRPQYMVSRKSADVIGGQGQFVPPPGIHQKRSVPKADTVPIADTEHMRMTTKGDVFNEADRQRQYVAQHHSQPPIGAKGESQLLHAGSVQKSTVEHPDSEQMRIITQTNTLPSFGSTFKTSTPKQRSNYEESIQLDPTLLLDDMVYDEGEDSYEEHKNALEVAEAAVRETSAGGLAVDNPHLDSSHLDSVDGQNNGHEIGKFFIYTLFSIIFIGAVPTVRVQIRECPITQNCL